MMLKNILWLVPFCLFVTGYFGAHILFRTQTIPMPSVIGLPLADAVTLLSHHSLNVRIASKKPSSDVPEGTVLMQSPGVHQSIRTHQTALLVISERPSTQKAPSYISLTRDDIEKITSNEQFPLTIVTVPHQGQPNICFAQHPSPGSCVPKEGILVYIAEKMNTPYIWPSYKGHTVEEVIPVLESMAIPYEISSHAEHYYSRHKILQAPIVEQYPRAGSLVSLEQESLPLVKLHIP